MHLAKCINGHEDLLKEGDIYTVSAITQNGNYLLEEVEVPEGYTSFNKDRFQLLLTTSEEIWTPEMEEDYWFEQPSIEDEIGEAL
jgi:hypothetical protein